MLQKLPKIVGSHLSRFRFHIRPDLGGASSEKAEGLLHRQFQYFKFRLVRFHAQFPAGGLLGGLHGIAGCDRFLYHSGLPPRSLFLPAAESSRPVAYFPSSLHVWPRPARHSNAPAAQSACTASGKRARRHSAPSMPRADIRLTLTGCTTGRRFCLLSVRLLFHIRPCFHAA